MSVKVALSDGIPYAVAIAPPEAAKPSASMPPADFDASSIALSEGVPYKVVITPPEATKPPKQLPSADLASSSIGPTEVKGNGSEVKKLDPTVCDKKGNNGLHRAVIQRDLAELRSLLTSHIELLEKRNHNGRTPLLLAARVGDIMKYDVLRKAGADENAVDELRRNVFHHAALKGQVDLITWLVKDPKLVNAQDDKHYTPLHLAARAGHYLVCETLLNAHANPHAKDSRGKTARQLAEQNKHTAIVRILPAPAASECIIM